MEIFGGFMVMMSILGLFLAVVWLIMPFVVFAIKGKQDRSLELLEIMEKRLTAIDQKLAQLLPGHTAESSPAAAPANHEAPSSPPGLQPTDSPLA